MPQLIGEVFMLARCIADSIDQLELQPVKDRLQNDFHLDGPIAELSIGEVYHVVALEARGGGIWLFLDMLEGGEYTYTYPIELFEIDDPAIPAGWCVGFESQGSGLMIKRISFPTWANDDSFYEKLVDGDTSAIESYEEARSRAYK
jgi:hypothetical protein